MVFRRKRPKFRACCVLYPSHKSEFYNPNNIRRIVGITKLPHVCDFFFSLLISRPRSLSPGDSQYPNTTLLTYVNLSPLQYNPSRLHCITYSHCYTRLHYTTRCGARGWQAVCRENNGFPVSVCPQQITPAHFLSTVWLVVTGTTSVQETGDINSFTVRAI